jgi:hypothetical protein
MAVFKAAAQPVTRRERSLASARTLGGAFVGLGFFSALAGIVVGSSVRQTSAANQYFSGGQAIAPIGWAFIISAVSTGLILALAGMTVIAFANALHPLADQP